MQCQLSPAADIGSDLLMTEKCQKRAPRSFAPRQAHVEQRFTGPVAFRRVRRLQNHKRVATTKTAPFGGVSLGVRAG